MGDAAFRIGVSGHQKLGDDTTIDFVSQQIQELFLQYQQQASQQGKEIVAYSALALGADQLFVRIAQKLGIATEAIIPCTRYDEIFSTPEQRDEYYCLLKNCREVHHLDFTDCTEDAYLEAGHWVVDHSDLIILAWNGLPAAGRGGTADVASYARFHNRPFVHIHTRHHTIKRTGTPN